MLIDFLTPFPEGDEEVSEEEEEYNMDTNKDFSDQRRYLERRLYEIREDKNKDLAILFGTRDDRPPESGTDLVQRIKDGKYVIELRQDDYFDNAISPDYIRWRDPSKVADWAGFHTARNKLWDTYEDVMDEIKVKDPIDGLAALKAFESAPIQ